MARDGAGGQSERDGRLFREMRSCLARAVSDKGRIDDSLTLREKDVVLGIYAQPEERRFWVDGEGMKASGKNLSAFIADAKSYGLFPKHYPGAEIRALRSASGDSARDGDEAVWARTELLLTDAFVRLARHLKVGRLPADSITDRKDSLIEATNMLSLLHRIDAGESVRSVLESMEPSHRGYLELRRALSAQLDSMDLKPYTYLAYPQKDSMRFIRQLQTRLYEGGYIGFNNKPADSAALSKAVAKAQSARKQKVDGKPGKELVRSLNNTDYHRFLRIAINLDRYKQLPDPMPQRHLWVNIPSYQLQLMDSGRVTLESRVIVGTAEQRTPVLTSGVDRIVTYPYWNVPYSIVFKEMLPRIKSNPSYLTQRNYEVVDRKGKVVDPHKVDWARMGPTYFPYMIRQKEGGFNSLGVLKFNFPNKYAVYLHDTNARALFGRSNRSLSHGCVRVQQWRELAEMLLTTRDTSGVQTDSLQAYLDRKQQRNMGVPEPVPIFLRYFTAYAKDGRVRFYEDIYGDDRLTLERYFSGRLM
jgi:murein L,D-transpeptidase YcbB/YkuD